MTAISSITNWSVWEQRFAHFLEQRGALLDPAHDLSHIRRVVANARLLAATENARLEIVLPAAWLHDCVIVPKESPVRSRASTEAARIASGFLEQCGYPSCYHADIAHAIEAHSFSAGIAPRTIEARVVQDADRLDAVGAIGIARCMMVGGVLSKALYHPDDPFAAARPLDDTTYTIDHFFVKLLNLADTMQTAAGSEEARARCAYMQTFLRKLGNEIGTLHSFTVPR